MDRKVVFVGDLVDRGSAIAEVIAIARVTVETSDGFAVMGNHKYNAIAFHRPFAGKQSKHPSLGLPRPSGIR